MKPDEIFKYLWTQQFGHQLVPNPKFKEQMVQWLTFARDEGVKGEREDCALECDEEEIYYRELNGKMKGEAAAFHHSAAKTAAHLARKIRARKTNGG